MDVPLLLVIAGLMTACGPINIHSERHYDIHPTTTIIRCDDPSDDASCHEVQAPPDESP